MCSECFHNGSIMPLLRLYYAYITLLLHYFKQHKYLYSALSGIVAMWCSFGSVFIALSLESSRCGALLEASLYRPYCPRRDVVFWKRLYSALSGIVAMWCSFGSVFIEHLLESSRCGALLESSLSNNDCWPSLNRLVKISVHVILDIGIVMRVC